MDFGKHKYGGPFTTKQVEDVKAFCGILKVLFFIGPAFMLQAVTRSMLPPFSKHGILFEKNESLGDYHFHQVYLEGATRHIIVSNGLLSPFLVVICIPVYLYLIRPHIAIILYSRNAQKNRIRDRVDDIVPCCLLGYGCGSSHNKI